MIEQQQDKIDVIATNIEDSHKAIDRGGRELAQAIDYRVASRKKLWCITFLCLILLGIIGVFIYIYVIKPSIDASNKKAQ